MTCRFAQSQVHARDCKEWPRQTPRLANLTNSGVPRNCVYFGWKMGQNRADLRPKLGSKRAKTGPKRAKSGQKRAKTGQKRAKMGFSPVSTQFCPISTRFCPISTRFCPILTRFCPISGPKSTRLRPILTPLHPYHQGGFSRRTQTHAPPSQKGPANCPHEDCPDSKLPFD